MAQISVHIKHAGKLYDVQLDQDLPPNAFKEAIYQVTGVPVDRMKVMVKGGVLKVYLMIVLSDCKFMLLLGRYTMEEDCTETRSDFHGHRCCW
jgi:hypothetical protein